MGGMGLLAASCTMLLKDPVRGQYDLSQTQDEDITSSDKVTPDSMKKKKEKEQKRAKPTGMKEVFASMKEMCENPICRNIFAAGFVRSLGGTIVTAYTPVFFGRTFPAFKA